MRDYLGMDGHPISLPALVRRDPEWAVSIIRHLTERLDCGQDVVCRTPPGCTRHWEERCRELVAERDAALGLLK